MRKGQDEFCKSFSKLTSIGSNLNIQPKAQAITTTEVVHNFHAVNDFVFG